MPRVGYHWFLKRKGPVGIIFALVISVSIGLKPQLATAAGGCAAPSTDYGTVTGLSITTDATTGTNTVWSRLAIPDTTNNSFLMEIDDSSDNPLNCYTVTGTAAAVYPAGATTNFFQPDGSNWVSTPVSLAANTTYHIKLIGNAPGVVVDRLLFPKSTSCVPGATDGTSAPTGTGDNCAVAADTTPPTGNITSPAANATVTNPTITVSASDDTAVSGVDIYDGATKLGSATLSSGSSQAGTWSYAWNTSTLAANGSHVLTAHITDGRNPVTTASVTVKIADTSAPTAAVITSPSSSGTNVAGTISLAASAVDNVAPTSFVFTITGPTAKTVTALPSSACGANTACVASNTLDTTKLTDGSYSITVVAKDAAGNTSLASPAVTFTVNNSPPPGDTTPPTISSISLAPNAVVSIDFNPASGPALGYKSSAYNVSVVAADNSGGSGLKQVSVKLNNGTPQVLTSGFNFPIDMSGLAMNGPLCTNTVPYTLTVVATDVAGNSKTSTVNFYATRAADMNDDCHVNYLDLSALASKYNQTSASLGRSDANHDGTVNYLDLSALAAQYGKF